MLYVVPLFAVILNNLLLTFTNDDCQKNIFQKNSFLKSYERILVSELAILGHKWSKINARKKVDFWVFANHSAVHSGEVIRGGCAAVAVGVRDM